MFNPTFFLEGKKRDDTVLIVLNQKIDRPDIFHKAWHATKYRVVTDGGADKLRELQNPEYIPDLIIGDFDSIGEGAREFYTEKGIEFVQDGDDYATDFMKAMRTSHVKFPGIKGFLAFGALGGRVDHCWHSYLCLSRARELGDDLVLVSDQSLTMALPQGTTRVTTPRTLVGKTCGFAPLLGNTAKVTTSGFRWDVTDWEMSFSTQLSTSNHLAADEVELTSQDVILLTLELR